MALANKPALTSAALLVIAGALYNPAFAEPHRLLQLSLEELFEVKVTSANKTPQPFADVPAAVFVISAEDIRRSTATSLPELLRLAPGVDARQIDASHWAVSIRGFNNEFADKLLVLVDGVSVFSSIFSGVNWDELDMDLAEIERIEVIRGPGASTWGVNAVNGVINVITRSADAAEGNRASIAYGDNIRPIASLKHSGRLGNALDYRLNAYFRRNGNSDGITDRGDTAADDDWLNRRLEFHSDLDLSGNDQLSLIVRAWNGQRRQISDLLTPLPPFQLRPHGGAEFRGGTTLVRLRQQRGHLNQQWQLYFDVRGRDELRFDSVDKTIDLEFTQNLSLTRGGNRVWGIGYRRLRNDTNGSFSFSIDPENSNEDLFTAFVQQSWRFLDQRLQLTLGSKFEHSSRAEGNVQPSIRLNWRPDQNNSYWAAISRAVSTPSLNDSNGRFLLSTTDVGGLTTFVALQGNKGVDAETMLAYEIGWRHRFGELISLDTTAFFHDYDDLLGALVPGTPVLNLLPAPYMELPVSLTNDEAGQLYGLEVAATWNISSSWRLTSSYSYTRLTGLTVPAKIISLPPPKQIFNLGSHYDLGASWELDANLRYNDNQPVLNVDAWWSLDLRLGWQPTERLNLHLIIKELLESEHFEYNDAASTETSSQGRAVLFKADWHF